MAAILSAMTCLPLKSTMSLSFCSDSHYSLYLSAFDNSFKFYSDMGAGPIGAFKGLGGVIAVGFFYFDYLRLR